MPGKLGSIWRRMFGPRRDEIVLPAGAQRITSYGYKGARRQGHNEKWAPTNKHPDEEISGYITRLRARSRDLTMNTPLGASFLMNLQDYVIGRGIVPQPRAVFANGKPHDTINTALAELYEQMDPFFDQTGIQDLAGMQCTHLRSIAEAGSSLVHMPFRSSDKRLRVPLQLRGFEPDNLADYVVLNNDTGNEIRHGIELDAKTNHIVAFHLATSLKERRVNQTKRIPEEEMIYGFRRDRWDQILGAPWCSPSIEKGHDLDEYEDAEIVRARAAAAAVHYVRGPHAAERMLQWSKQQEKDSGGTERVEEINIGQRTYLDKDEDIIFADPNVPPGNYEGFVVQGRRIYAVGVGMSYELLTGDHTKTHFSAARATWQRDVRRFQCQQRFIIWTFCRKLWLRFVDTAVLAGVLPIKRSDYFQDPMVRHRLTRAGHKPPGFPWHDPLKDVAAAQIALALGLDTRDRLCTQRGLVFAEVIEVLAKEEKMIEDAGLKMVSAPGDLKLMAAFIGVEDDDEEGGDDGRKTRRTRPE